MKKSYIKILIFEIIAFAVLISNSFNSSILTGYRLPLLLVVLNIIFYLMLGKEKDNKRERKEVMFDITLCSILYILLYYILGIIIGYARNSNYLSTNGLIKIILPLVSTIVLKEFLRGLILKKCGNVKPLIILTTILFIMIDLSGSLSNMLKPIHESFVYIALYFIPAITTNIFLTYTTKKVSYKASMIFLIITTLYKYILPIIPNPNEYIKSIIDLLIPIIFMVRVKKISNKFKVQEKEITKDEVKKMTIQNIILTFIVLIFVYFVSGYFKYYAIAIVSNSMKPKFERGSMVIIEQTKEKYRNLDNIKNGDIIAFIQNKTIVVHRVIKIITIGDEKFYYTKGDNNNFEDNWCIKEENILGIVKTTIPYIGYPIVLFSEL